MGRFEYGLEAAERALETARSYDELNAALRTVINLQATLGDPELRGHKMFSTELDRLATLQTLRLGLLSVPLAKHDEHNLIVMSAIYQVGGHSRVAADLCEMLGPNRSTILLTGSYHPLSHTSIPQTLKNLRLPNLRSMLILSAPTPIARIMELYTLIAALRPGRIFLLSHNMDIVPIVALWPFRDTVEYLHHADHLPTLGATLPFGKHVDLTWRCHLACREAGLDPIYAGLGAVGLPETARSSSPASERIRIATCGSNSKFAGARDYRWADFAAAALCDLRAEFIHIGPATEKLKCEIWSGLAGTGIDPNRYQFVGIAPNLSQALIEYEVDIYLGSYPEAGGKASLEAMAAGFHPIVPIDDATPELLRFDFPTPTWTRISQPGELPAAIERVRGRSDADRALEKVLIRGELDRFETYVRKA